MSFGVYLPGRSAFTNLPNLTSFLDLLFKSYSLNMWLTSV